MYIIYIYIYIYIHTYMCKHFDNHIVNGIRRKTNQKLKQHYVIRKTFLTLLFVTTHSSGCAKADV